ncbi:MAG: hypothetical protein ACJAS1_003300 [Oleiphilaceae bacterium]|jgi:hypothetical protein
MNIGKKILRLSIILAAVALISGCFFSVERTPGGTVELSTGESCDDVDCSFSMFHAQAVTFTAMPLENFVFKGWLGDRSLCDDDPTCTYYITGANGNRSAGFIAMFEPDPTLFHVMGTNIAMTREELTEQLADEGLFLTNKTTLESNECTVAYANSNARDMTGEIGMLTCNRQFGNGDSELSVKVIYGGCEIANSRFGGGSRCEAGVVTEELKIAMGNDTYTEVELKAAGMEYCSAISEEMVCANAGADLIAVGLGFKNGAGTGVGAGVGIGYGAGVSGGVEDDVFSFGMNAKLGVGVSFEFSLNYQEDLMPVVSVGKDGFVLLGGHIVGVGKDAVPYFKNLGKNVTIIGEDTAIEIAEFGEGAALTIYQDGFMSGVDYFEDLGSDFVNLIDSFI